MDLHGKIRYFASTICPVRDWAFTTEPTEQDSY